MFIIIITIIMKGHSGSVKAITQHCMLSATKQAISMTLATTVGHFLHDLLFANVYMA